MRVGQANSLNYSSREALWPRSCVANSIRSSYKLHHRHKIEDMPILSMPLVRLLCCLQNDSSPLTMDALIPTAYSYRAFLSIKMLVLRLLVAVFFHLPIVLSYPHYPTHLALRGGLSTDPPLPTATAPSIPTSLPPPSTTPTLNPTTTGNPWTDMCKLGAECDCSRIEDKNGDE